MPRKRNLEICQALSIVTKIVMPLCDLIQKTERLTTSCRKSFFILLSRIFNFLSRFVSQREVVKNLSFACARSNTFKYL